MCTCAGWNGMNRVAAIKAVRPAFAAPEPVAVANKSALTLGRDHSDFAAHLVSHVEA